MEHGERVWLDCAFEERDELKAAVPGKVHFDRASKRWWVDAATVAAKRPELAKWLPPNLGHSGNEPHVDLTIMGMSYGCWRCGEVSVAVVELRTLDETVEAYSGHSLRLAAAALSTLSPNDLDSRLAYFHRRFSATRGEVYFSNGCRSCDAIFGDFKLGEVHFEITSEHGDIHLIELGVVNVPQRFVDWVIEHLEYLEPDPVGMPINFYNAEESTARTDMVDLERGERRVTAIAGVVVIAILLLVESIKSYLGIRIGVTLGLFISLLTLFITQQVSLKIYQRRRNRQNIRR